MILKLKKLENPAGFSQCDHASLPLHRPLVCAETQQCRDHDLDALNTSTRELESVGTDPIDHILARITAHFIAFSFHFYSMLYYAWSDE